MVTIEVLGDFIEGERGGISEYGALLALVLIITVGAMVYIAPKIKGVFEAIGSKL